MYSVINPFMYGTWILRVSNDINLNTQELNYIQIKEEPVIKFKTLKQDGFMGVKKSRTSYIKNITQMDNNTYSFALQHSNKNTYSYSLFGIQIPEFKSKSLSYTKVQNFVISSFEKTLLIVDNENEMYYLFDLHIGNLKYPNAETNINTFIFTQIFSILLNLIIIKLL
jgi:hypothetical protein